MKKTISGIVFLSLICLSSSLYAGAKEEACEMVLCLYGEKNGKFNHQLALKENPRNQRTSCHITSVGHPQCHRSEQRKADL